MFPSDLDEWARDHGEPEAFGPQARLYRYGIGADEEESEEGESDDRD